MLFLRQRAVNQHGEVLLSSMKALLYPVRMEGGIWRVMSEGEPLPTEGDFLHGPVHDLLLPRRLAQPRAALRTAQAIWSDCCPAVRRLAGNHRTGQERELKKSLARTLSKEKAALAVRLSARREEVAALATPRYQERLRHRLQRIHDDIYRRGFLFASMEALAEAEMEEARRELSELDQSVAHLQKSLADEEHFLMNKVLPGRYRTADRLQAFVEGVAIILPAELWSFQMEVRR